MSEQASPTGDSRCFTCGGVLPPARTRPRKYCGQRCRQKAWRNREHVVACLARIELIKAELSEEIHAAAMDWSDEDHRVA